MVCTYACVLVALRPSVHFQRPSRDGSRLPPKEKGFSKLEMMVRSAATTPDAGAKVDGRTAVNKILYRACDDARESPYLRRTIETLTSS